MVVCLGSEERFHALEARAHVERKQRLHRTTIARF